MPDSCSVRKIVAPILQQQNKTDNRYCLRKQVSNHRSFTSISAPHTRRRIPTLTETTSESGGQTDSRPTKHPTPSAPNRMRSAFTFPIAQQDNSVASHRIASRHGASAHAHCYHVASETTHTTCPFSADTGPTTITITTMILAPCIWANCASANPMACSPPSSHDSALAAPRDERIRLSCRPTRRSRRWQSVSNKILLSQSKLSCTHCEMILQG